eukprot:TRINITY_DN39448_c0_g1_i1.p1 TRINITY_DN39448_c0_g1~~TRINITY_DN39448_c0_g1_i1.p1  ORF type:complete len:106 (+),score=20.09 TRINITY_DN39448_c0_g1_i1:289-606(+)
MFTQTFYSLGIWTSVLPTLLIAAFILIFLYKLSGISSDTSSSCVEHKTMNDELPLSDAATEPKIVTDPGKALCQMVKFQVRFQRKVKRFRERRKEPELKKLGDSE